MKHVGFFVIFIIVMVLIIVACIYAIWEMISEELLILRLNLRRKKKRKIDPRYESSIKCKYCAHFNERTNRCHLYSKFDASLDKGNDAPYYKDTMPDDRCENFMLPAMDVILCMDPSWSRQRSDGTYIVSLEDAYL